MTADGILIELIEAGYIVTVRKDEIAIDVGAKTFIYKHHNQGTSVYHALKRAWAGEPPDVNVPSGTW